MNPVKIKYRSLAVLIFFMAACNNGGNNTHLPIDTATAVIKDSSSIVIPVAKENDIFDTLNTLSFIKESNRYIDSITKHKHSIAYIIDTTDKEYTITAGFNGEERFETYYRFTIDKKTKAIKVQDDVSGDMVTPEEFEKKKRH
jgi:hypothetical protein